MRLIGLSLALPFLVAACGQSLKPFQGFDAGDTAGDDMSAGGGGGTGGGDGGTVRDMAGGDLAGADTDPPDIAYVKPMPGQFVGGIMDLIVTITDATGVDSKTVKATIQHDPSTTVMLVPTGMPGTYHALFTLTAIGKTTSFLHIDVVADDVLGNHAELGEEAFIDTTPPWMTMNGAVSMHLSQLDNTTGKLQCSHTLFPLGPVALDPNFDNTPEAAFEGAVLKQAMGLRARIEDRGNHVPGQRVDYFSDIDETTVTLYAVGIVPPATTLPALAVDTDGDGICDDVNPNLVPTSGTIVMPDEALALAMSPLTDSGTADFTPVGSIYSACQEDGTAMAAPDVLCKRGGTKMTFVIPWFGKDKPIYSLPPIHDPDACVGVPLDASNRVPEGPVCVLVRAADNAGNHMVSYPLHVCVDLGNHKCDTFSPDANACTGVLAGGMVTSGSTCTPPPSPTVAAPFPNPGTFLTDGTEVRDLDAFK